MVCWAHSSLFFCVTSYSSGVHHFGWDFCVCDQFFNPTIEVVTFRLHGGCMLGVFVAGIHPSRTWMSGSFVSVWWNACVHRLDLGLYSHPKVFLEWSQNPCWLQGKNPLYWRLRGRSDPATLHHVGQGAQHTTHWASVALLQSLNPVKRCPPGHCCCLSSSLLWSSGGGVVLPLPRWKGPVSAEPSCRFCQPVCFIPSYQHERASSGEILGLELSVWQRRSAALDHLVWVLSQISSGLAGLTWSLWRWQFF